MTVSVRQGNFPSSPHFTLLFPQEKGQEGPQKGGQALLLPKEGPG